MLHFLIASTINFLKNVIYLKTDRCRIEKIMHLTVEDRVIMEELIWEQWEEAKKSCLHQTVGT